MHPHRKHCRSIPETARLGIVCEGRDEDIFLQAFFQNHMKDPYSAGRIFIVSAEGNSQIGERLLSLKNVDGLSNLRYLAVVRDAEKDVHGAQQSVHSAFRKAGFCIIPQKPGRWYAPTPEELLQHREWRRICTGFLLFPKCDTAPIPGTLEDLANTTIAEQNAEEHLHLAEAYLKEARSARNLSSYTEPHKNLFYAYLAGTDNAKGCKIGEAARAHIFDWDAPEYEYMTCFFRKALEI